VNRDVQQHFLARYGIDPAAFTGGPEDVRPAIAAAVRSTLAPGLGADVSELHDAQLSDDFHYTLFPNVTFNIFGLSAWVFRHRPHPADPQRMLFDFWDLLRAPAHAMPRPAHRQVVLGEVDAGLVYRTDRLRVVVRPSGTEPKLKCYLEFSAPVDDSTDLDDARRTAAEGLAVAKAELRERLSMDN
jgi:hypothetical protein